MHKAIAAIGHVVRKLAEGRLLGEFELLERLMAMNAELERIATEHEKSPARATAYLVAVFKLVDNTPTFLGAEIYSEPEPTFGANHRCWMLWREDSDTYASAKARLLNVISSLPTLSWVRSHLLARS